MVLSMSKNSPNIRSESTRTIRNGIIRYYDANGGDLHRIGGPAVIYPNGTTWWYENGSNHSEGRVSTIYGDGEIWYYLNGLRKLHG